MLQGFDAEEMVGFDPGAQGAAPSAEEAALAGSAAGLVTRALISPLDVLKIRFQVMPCLLYETKSFKSLYQFLVSFIIVQYVLLYCIPYSCPQLQIEPVSSRKAEGKYRGFFQGFRCIQSEEGLSAFWKGHIPAQLLSICYGAVQVCLQRRFEACPSKQDNCPDVTE